MKKNGNNFYYRSKFCLVFLFLICVGCGFEVVNTGYRGIKTKFGEIQGEPLPEGLHFYSPFSESVREFNVQERKREEVTDCFTSDTQHVKVTFVITYYPEPNQSHHIFQKFGEDWEEKIIQPASLGAVRDSIGRYIADDLVLKLEQAKKTVEDELRTSLLTRSINLTRLDFTHLDFDVAYKNAIEAKVVAVQRAAEAKNKTVEIEEQAKQKLIAAKAEAKSMEIRAEAIAKNKGLIDYEAVQKWNGTLPQFMTGSNVPFLFNLKQNPQEN